MLVVFNYFILFPSTLKSQGSEIIRASFTYVMGDNDSKSDAKRISFLEAKRLCIEKAGTYFESFTIVKDYKISSDEIYTYAAALLKVEIENQSIEYKSGTMIVTTKVKAKVEKNYIESRIKDIKQDKQLEKSILEQQRKIVEMEKRLADIQKQLSLTDNQDVYNKRLERKSVAKNLSMLENIRNEISRSTNLAVDNIELGMKKVEILRLIGKWRSEDHGHLNYGKVWVIMESGIVSCIVKSEIFVSYRSCSSYRNYHSEGVIK